VSGELGPLRAAVERLMEAQRETLEVTIRALDAEGEGLDGERSGRGRAPGGRPG
jgi:hypothetical protein